MTYAAPSNFPRNDRLNDRMVREVQATGPTSYATGGDAVDAASLGLGTIFGVYGVLTSGTGGAIRIPVLDFTNQKIWFFIPNTGAEVANAIDLSSYTGTLLFTGK